MSTRLTRVRYAWGSLNVLGKAFLLVTRGAVGGIGVSLSLSQGLGLFVAILVGVAVTLAWLGDWAWRVSRP